MLKVLRPNAKSDNKTVGNVVDHIFILPLDYQEPIFFNLLERY